MRVGRGKHSAIVGLCRRVYHDQEPEPVGPYKTVLHLGFYENYAGYSDRPNSKVTNCLREVFGIDWDATLGRYYCNHGEQAMLRAGAFLRKCGCKDVGGKYNAIIIHYEGNTSPSKKNLAHWQASAICELVLKCGRVPILLDWDRRSPLPDEKRIFCPATGPGDVWGGFGSGDAEIICAMIRQAEAYVGVDSGPGKIASATDTPTLICWLRHHPIQFHDPAENTVHLVPEQHWTLPPVAGNVGIKEFFEKHYAWRGYHSDHGLVAGAQEWLAEVLGKKSELASMTGVTFVLPPGIGDVVWALTKIKSIAGGRPIDVILSGDPRQEVDRRCVPFLKRFGFIRDAQVMNVPILQDESQRTDNRGRYRYVSDGISGNYHFLIPNTTLESGRRLEDWLPEHPVDWDVMRDFSWDGTERGEELAKQLGRFVCFYLGPETGNTSEGHNRGWLWTTQDWLDLGAGMTKRDVKVVVLGAPYDRSFYERYLQENVRLHGQCWIDLIGHLEIGNTFRLLREARCLVSYQCGLAIGNHYLGGKTVTWWRPDGDSCSETQHVSFSEDMRNAWIRPGWEDRYLGLVYGKCTPASILEEIDRKEWLK